MNDPRALARQLDAGDPLAGFRTEFVLADDLIYLDGNSLGRLPRATATRLVEAVEQEWGTGLIRSWTQWIELSAQIGDELGAAALGAGRGQVLICDSTTVNLYKLLSAALAHQRDADSQRRVILTDDDNFPTDRFVAAGLAAHGQAVVRLLHTDPDLGVRAGDIENALAPGDVAVLSLSHVAYRSGALADLPRITELAHAHGALALWDLAHSVGSVPVDLDAAGVDLAVGCTYKYLNAGPGAPGFLYVRGDLIDRLDPPIWGWFGQRDQFAMAADHDPAPGITRFAAGTPPVLGLHAVRQGVALIAAAGIGALATKGRELTSYAAALSEEWLAPLGFRLASPESSTDRGAHLTLHHQRAWQICQAAISVDVVADYRTPDRLRVGPAPIYTRFIDVHDGLARIRDLVVAGEHLRFPEEVGAVT